MRIQSVAEQYGYYDQMQREAAAGVDHEYMAAVANHQGGIPTGMNDPRRRQAADWPEDQGTQGHVNDINDYYRQHPDEHPPWSVASDGQHQEQDDRHASRRHAMPGDIQGPGFDQTGMMPGSMPPGFDPTGQQQQMDPMQQQQGMDPSMMGGGGDPSSGLANAFLSNPQAGGSDSSSVTASYTFDPTQNLY